LKAAAAHTMQLGRAQLAFGGPPAAAPGSTGPAQPPDSPKGSCTITLPGGGVDPICADGITEAWCTEMCGHYGVDPKDAWKEGGKCKA
jgi:hypothetical protein